MLVAMRRTRSTASEDLSPQVLACGEGSDRDQVDTTTAELDAVHLGVKADPTLASAARRLFASTEWATDPVTTGNRSASQRASE